MTFKPATRAGTKTLIGIFGGSGSGKTLSSLLLARGLVGPAGQIFMIDTESRRGEIFADEIPGGYQVSQLTEPFSSERYMEKIQEAETAAAGSEACLIIDSISHEWEGIGGVCSAAEALAEAAAKRGNYEWNGTVQFGHWKKPKVAHKQLVLKMLQSPLHIIVCLRADYKSHQVDKRDYERYGIKSNAKTTVIRDDFQTPIQDSKFIYEMTIQIELDRTNPGAPKIAKCPGMIVPAFAVSPLISIETGAALRKWIEGGSPASEEMVKAAAEAREMAECGTAVYQDWFGRQPGPIKAHLAKHTQIHQDCKKTAAENDEPAEDLDI